MKRSYYFNVTEVKDNKTVEVMNFNFGGHHDLAAMVENAKSLGLDDKHAKEFVLGMRLMHHVLKKNPQNEKFAAFFPKFEEFKKTVSTVCQCEPCGCN